MWPFEPCRLELGFNKQASYGPHEGIDLNLQGTWGNQDCGTNLKSISAGTCVATLFRSTDYGTFPVIETTFAGSTYYLRYAHCQDLLIKPGDHVSVGQVIAHMGSTGNSTACHLHLDILKKKPAYWWFYTKNVLEWFVDPIWFINNYKEGTMDGNVQVPSSDFQKLVTNSTKWDGVHKYLELEGDPATTPLEAATNKIGGYKSQATTLRNQLAQAEAEIKNREEQVSRLKAQIDDLSSLHKKAEESIISAMQEMDKIRREYEGRLEVLQAQVDGVAQDKGELQKRIAVLESENAELRKGIKKDWSLWEWITYPVPWLISTLKQVRMK